MSCLLWVKHTGSHEKNHSPLSGLWVNELSDNKETTSPTIAHRVMAFLPLAGVAQVISDKGTIGSGTASHNAGFCHSLPAYLYTHSSTECCWETKPSFHCVSLVTFDKAGPALSPFIRLAGVSHGPIKQPSDLPFITTPCCLGLLGHP